MTNCSVYIASSATKFEWLVALAFDQSTTGFWFLSWVTLIITLEKKKKKIVQTIWNWIKRITIYTDGINSESITEKRLLSKRKPKCDSHYALF